MEEFLDLIGNYFFPMVLSVYLVIKIDRLMTSLILNQKEFADKIFLEMREIKKDITSLHLDISSSSKK